jgi:hypothetical protein
MGGPEPGPGPTIYLRPVQLEGLLEYEWDNGERYHKVVFSMPGAFNERTLEYVTVREIYEKFPQLPGLSRAAGPNTFFVIKLWVDLDYQLPPNARDTYTLSGRLNSPGPHRRAVQLSSRVNSFGKQVVEKSQVRRTRDIAGGVGVCSV